MHINLLSMLPLDLRANIDNQYSAIIQVKAKERFLLYPRFKPMIHHYSNDDKIRQAATQYLAHHQCIISNILFGISLCPSSTARGSVTSNEAAERYLCNGINTLYRYHQKLDFSYLTVKHKMLWEHCCHTFLLYEYKNSDWNNELVEFVESQCNPEIFFNDKKSSNGSIPF